jgi:single-strand DNA-binding protein
MVNRVTLIGNVGRDPESRTFSNGGGVVSFSLATTERWKNRETGEPQTRTEWHNISCFNEALSKVILQYVKKGSKLFVEGQIQSREYTDKDGAQRKSFEIVLPKFGGVIELLDSKPHDAPAERPREEPRRQEPQRRGSMKDALDDQIPFMMEWR